MKRLHIQLVCLTLMLMCSAVEAAAEVVLVVSKESPIESVSRHEVSDIFLGSATRLPKVGKVMPLDRVEDDLRAEFYRDYIGRDLSQIKAHWAKNIFTGRGYPPKAVNSLDELKTLLQKNPSAIGYVTPDKVDSSMRILTMR